MTACRHGGGESLLQIKGRAQPEAGHLSPRVQSEPDQTEPSLVRRGGGERGEGKARPRGQEGKVLGQRAR